MLFSKPSSCAKAVIRFKCPRGGFLNWLATYSLLIGFLVSIGPTAQPQSRLVTEWQGRVRKTVSEQPAWPVPVVTPSSSLVQLARFDAVRQITSTGTNPIIEKADVECVAGKGLRGDRFFEYQEDYKGQITFFSIEVLQEVCEALSISTPSAGVVRRNVIVEGIDLNQLIGKTFEVQGVLFEGVCECKPCYWMDQAIAPGAEVTLQGRGGLRAKILTDGRLRVDVGRVMPQHSQSSLVLQSYQDRANGARSVICLSQAIS